jgi:hypothetical protein
MSYSLTKESKAEGGGSHREGVGGSGVMLKESFG